jgi:hypothetical protein
MAASRLHSFYTPILFPVTDFAPSVQTSVNLYQSFSWFVRTNSVEQEPEGSSPHSQQLATGPCTEPVESNPHPQAISVRSNLVPSSHLRLGLPNGLFPSGFPAKTLYTFLSSPVRATCPAHLIRLDLICPMISGDGYKL